MHRQQILQTFLELVTIDSPTGVEDQIADVVSLRLKAEGTRVKRDAFGNVYGIIAGEGQPLFLSAHLDTVEPGRNIKPKVGKVYVTSEGNTILGADNKVGIAGILCAIAELPKHHRPIEVIFTRSEEIGNYGAINFAYSLLKAKKGYCFDLSQPVGTITTASPFYERFDIQLIGKSAHASHPEDAVNVLPALGEILKMSPLGKADEETFFNIGVVSGGDVRNTILGNISLKGEIRSFVSDGLVTTKELFRKNLRKIVTRYNLQVIEDWVWENPGYKHTSQEAEKYIADTKMSIQDIGLDPIIIQTAGVSDANIFNDKGLLCINLGNGSEFSHTVKERIKIAELENLTNLITTLVTH